jgi:sugar phosphate isomerase/epimerase
MQLGGALGHLTYCTNIHAGEPLDEVMAGLAKHLPEIKAGVAGAGPLGVGLRLGHAAASRLREPAALAQLKRFLAEGNYYVFTINGFPYGAFHGRTVKEDAYKPDWSTAERLAYTDLLADILSELLPAGQQGSVSTVPCTFKPWAEGRLEAITENLIRHVARLVGIAAETGQTIALALEPEPCCYLETIDEAVAFFNGQLFSRAGVARLAAITGLPPGAAESAMRRHIGVCYDVCHAAVEFEDPKDSVERLRAAGIQIPKLQLSSALKVASFDQQSARHLAAFAEPVYLHQVVQKKDGALRRFVDLPQALAEDGAGGEWRVHFHVPLFLGEMQHFGTTQSFLAEILRLHRAAPISRHLEVETYTWDVLPASYRNVSLSSAIARELNWVKAQLQ